MWVISITARIADAMKGMVFFLLPTDHYTEAQSQCTGQKRVAFLDLEVRLPR